MSKLKSQLAVIEGKWSDETNTSVRGLFDLLSDINFNNPHSYIYEMFCDYKSLDNIVGRMAINAKIKYLYIGAHGLPDVICGHGGNITRVQLKNILSKTKSGSIEGLFLGTCFFGNEDNAEYLLNPPTGSTPIKWIAGYITPIDWINSSVLDLLFWNNFFKTTGTPVAKIKTTAKLIKKYTKGLVSNLKFCIYIRKSGPYGGIQNLLE